MNPSQEIIRNMSIPADIGTAYLYDTIWFYRKPNGGQRSKGPQHYSFEYAEKSHNTFFVARDAGGDSKSYASYPTIHDCIHSFKSVSKPARNIKKITPSSESNFICSLS